MRALAFHKQIGCGIFLATWLFAMQTAAQVHPESPPQNPYLAHSIYPIGHGTSAQQDTVAPAGPLSTTRRLTKAEIDYTHLGPAHFGSSISSPYADGRRVIWSNGLNGVFKADHESFQVIAHLATPGASNYTPEHADKKIARFDKSTKGLFSIIAGMRTASMLRDLSSVYTLLDKDNRYYIGDKAGKIFVYGDSVEGNPNSPISLLDQVDLDDQVTGFLMGMNMTFDGWIILATEHGYIVAISRDLKQQKIIRLHHSEGAEDKATGPTGYGWVRNGIAIDEAGGLYVASQDHMHKVIWTGERLSVDEADGAWTAEYPNGTGDGTGATPSLMGFGEEDRFVVITDGDPLMNVTLFWRDDIPEDWQRQDDATSRRIAGRLPANMDRPALDAIQSEQSVVVAGYGALVVNNNARNVPWYLPTQAVRLLVSYLGSDPHYQPYGIQKFEWNPQARKLEAAWVNNEISSPNCVPLVSAGSDRLYLVGARDGDWTLEAIDWTTGAADFHFIVGGERYNSLFAGTLMDEAGRMMWGTSWGRVRLSPQ